MSRRPRYTTIDHRVATSAMGHSRRDWLRATIGPRPLRPESDHSRHEFEMANCDLTHCSKRHRLFDDLVGADEQNRRDFEAERPGGSQIDD